MGIHFLFPAHPVRPAVVDELFAEQVAALAEAGFTTSLVSDAVLRGERPLRDVPVGSTVVYRGWMLNAVDYARLAEAIVAASAVPLTSPAAYLATHHLPNWYPLVSELTPETCVLASVAEPQLRWNRCGGMPTSSRTS